jgi:predicted Zn-dependent peptidase
MVRYASRITTVTSYVFLIVALAAVLLAGCGEEGQETDTSPGGQPATSAGPGEITSFRLDNGISVYLREDRSQPQVAVLTLYRAGVIHEDKGNFHVSRVLPHMLIFSPTASFDARGAVDSVSKTGRVNGEVFGDFVRFEYTAESDQLDLLYQVEAERLTSVKFNEDQLQQFAMKCRDDVDTSLEKANLSMSKYGLMALNHAVNHGTTSIPIYQGMFDVSIDDLERFHAERYRPAEMVLVTVGDFDTDTATRLIKKHFGSIGSNPAATSTAGAADGDIRARWDVPSTVMFLLYPGPYQNETERLVLTMFGTYLTRRLKGDTELNRDLKSSLCSNTLYPVGDIPFFVFTELRRGRSPEDIRVAVLEILNESLQSVDERTFAAMKGNLVGFLQMSVLESQRKLSSMPHQKALIQEALDIAKRHYVRNGRATEEFLEILDAITYEDAMRYLETRLAADKSNVVTIRQQ